MESGVRDPQIYKIENLLRLMARSAYVVDGTGSGSCPIMVFCISGDEPPGSVTTILITVHIVCSELWYHLI
jgi:hypothetical protein